MKDWLDNTEAAPETDTYGEIMTGVMVVFASLFAYWAGVYIDPELGNRYVAADEIVVAKDALMQPVLPDERVVKRSLVERLRSERDAAVEHLDAFGIEPFSGDPAGAVYLIDLTLDADDRQAVDRIIRTETVGSVSVVGFGDRVLGSSQDLREVGDGDLDAVADQVAAWQGSTERRLVDALEAALTTPGVTRVVLCAAGLPTDSLHDAAYLIDRNGGRVPVNTVGFTDDEAARRYLIEVANATGGTFSRGG